MGARLAALGTDTCKGDFSLVACTNLVVPIDLLITSRSTPNRVTPLRTMVFAVEVNKHTVKSNEVKKNVTFLIRNLFLVNSNNHKNNHKFI